MPDWDIVAEHIHAATGASGPLRVAGGVTGGDINRAWRVECGGEAWFVKANRPERLAMFEAEAEGLAELAASHAVRVPRPCCHGVAGDSAFLVLEHLELGGRGDARRLGENLAAMHRVTRPEAGWHRDNTIGSTPQPNGPVGGWARFWRERRLAPQLDLLATRGADRRLRDRGARLLEAVPALLAGHEPPAALLHGDLWGGNHGYLADGTPVLFDPAVYFGDRETDLAMTELFGGFAPAFREAYEAQYPLDAGYAVRRDLYNLYHVLNHANLFGGGYAGRALHLVDALLAEAGA